MDIEQLIKNLDRVDSDSNIKISHNIVSFFSLFNKFKEVLSEDFVHDEKYGYINSSPKYLGSGLKINMELKLHNYLKNEQYIMNKISTSNKFSFEILDNLEGRILLKNVITLGRYENEIINDLFKMANLLVEKDKDDDKEHEKEHEKEKQQENDKDLN